ncbi:MAG: anhydro-N-acetylmuramic acid kinase [Geodermatophilaceae bacterium]|nr:anhydro-N-acetylmuramic acid kinase [Geodermatophilaceae bacterium]
MRVVGLISGTSYDGIDAAAADLSLAGDEVTLRPRGAISVPYPEQLRADLVAAMPPAPTTAEAVCRLDTLIGQAFADVAVTAVAELGGGRADLVVSHGQTLYHWVDGRDVLGTLQVGQPAWIAERTGLPVLADIRARDVAVGGQGAPLVSLFDVLLLGASDRPTAALNLGGISNLTIMGPGRAPIAFDVGPANTLMDAAVSHGTGGAETFDRDGARAGRGEIAPDLLLRLLADPYYALAAPKSTGKEHFNLAYLLSALSDVESLALDDVVATVTALTAQTVVAACRDNGVESVIAAGGGTANPVLMAGLRAAMPEVEMTTIDERGVSSDAKEAYAFALIGFLALHGLPGTVASCTGASRSAVLGSLVPGAAGFPKIDRPSRPPRRLRIAAARR